MSVWSTYSLHALILVYVLLFSRLRLNQLKDPKVLVHVRRSIWMSAVRLLVLSFFARSGSPLSFVSAQVTGETTYTLGIARSRLFGEDTRFRSRGKIIEILSRWKFLLSLGENDRKSNIKCVHDRLKAQN